MEFQYGLRSKSGKWYLAITIHQFHINPTKLCRIAKFLFEKIKKVRSNNLTSTGYGKMNVYDALMKFYGV